MRELGRTSITARLQGDEAPEQAFVRLYTEEPEVLTPDDGKAAAAPGMGKIVVLSVCGAGLVLLTIFVMARRRLRRAAEV